MHRSLREIRAACLQRENGRRGKPAPVLFLYAARGMGAAPSRAFAIEGARCVFTDMSRLPAMLQAR